MATSIFVYPYKQGSKSAVALSQALGGKTLRLEGSKFVPSANKVVVNWGSVSVPEEFVKKGVKVLNPSSLVKTASNKKIFFEKALALGDEGPRIPPFTLSKEKAALWFTENPKKEVTVFARTVLAGHSGEGIVKVSSLEQLDTIQEGTLLCLYIPKRREFRFHVSKTQGVFSVQEKKAKADFEGQVDFQVRNLANGFIFARNELKDVPEDAKAQAKKALALTGLDFGAVDVIWNEKQALAYVLEVNTAPGLEGTTLVDYANMFEKELA